MTNGLCVIEWGELIEPILKSAYLKISFSRDNTDNNIRNINFEPHSQRLKENTERVLNKCEF